MFKKNVVIFICLRHIFLAFFMQKNMVLFLLCDLEYCTP